MTLRLPATDSQMHAGRCVLAQRYMQHDVRRQTPLFKDPCPTQQDDMHHSNLALCDGACAIKKLQRGLDMQPSISKPQSCAIIEQLADIV